MAQPAPKKAYQVLPLQAGSKGIYDSIDQVTPMGFTAKQEELTWWNGGLRNRLPWIGEDNESTLGSMSDLTGNGIEYEDVGHARGYAERPGLGKVIVFEKLIKYNNDQTVSFTSGTESGTRAVPSGETEFLGALYFRNAFLVYTANKLYTLDIDTDALTEELEFAVDIGADYGPIIGMFERFGQLWTVSEEDRIFWSDTREYQIGAGSLTTTGLAFGWGWQYLYGGKLVDDTTPPVVRFSYSDTKQCHAYPGNPFGNWYALHSGSNHVYVADGEQYWVGQKVSFTGDSGEYTVTAVAQVEFEMTQAYYGDTYKYMYLKEKGGPIDNIHYALLDTYEHGWKYHITSVAPSTVYDNDMHCAKTSAGNGVNRLEFSSASHPPNLIAIDNSVITCYQVWKVTLDGSLSSDTPTSSMTVRTEYVVDPANYEVSYDPDSDDTIDGNIKLDYLPEYDEKENPQFWCDYYPFNNPWLSGNSGFIDIASSKGSNITYVEGPSKDEDEGAGMFYVFKTDAIYAVMGKPGPNGTVGTLDIKSIATGIKARHRTAQVSQSGVYFGELLGNDYNIRYFPHGVIMGTQVPIISTQVDFGLNSDLTRWSETFSEVGDNLEESSIIFNGDLYLLKFSIVPTGTEYPPSEPDCMYVGQALRADNGTYYGRWARWKEYQSETVDSTWLDGRTLDIPHTVGFYKQQGSLMRIYTLRSAYGRLNSTTHANWQVARYGTNPYINRYENDCEDQYILTGKYTGSSLATVARIGNPFRPTLLTGKVTVAEWINIKELILNIEHHVYVGGADDEGATLYFDAYKDLNQTSIFGSDGPLSISYLTDWVTKARKAEPTGINFNCQYFQFLLYWDNILSIGGGDANDSYIHIRNIAIRLAVHGKGEQLIEGDRDFD